MGDSTIPGTLFDCITFLIKVLPAHSDPTFIELLIGAMLTQTGFVTDAWLAIHPLRTWTAYYKWLQQGKWSWVLSVSPDFKRQPYLSTADRNNSIKIHLAAAAAKKMEATVPEHKQRKQERKK